MVEERMFRGYIEAAQKTLAENPGSIQALGLANEYFREALKLKPNDAEVARQSEMANKFLQAQRFFSQGSWGSVIENLEYVYIAEAGYAGGVARQALYEAYVARGNEEMAIGDFDTALSDFQRAAVLAEEDPPRCCACTRSS
jgi:tetratricopeptide (TPR) repeat protein